MKRESSRILPLWSALDIIATQALIKIIAFKLKCLADGLLLSASVLARILFAQIDTL